MKLCVVSTLALLAFLSKAAGQDGNSVHREETEEFWSAYIEDVNSFPSAVPSAGPSPAPSSAPSAKPSAEPSPAPSAKPSAEPSPAPSSAPSSGPTLAPVSGEPTPAPSPAPSAEPSLAPSGFCVIELDLNCTAVFGGSTIECEEIPAEEELVCSCPECVRELLFIYTGAACDGLATCVDSGTNPFTAGIRVTNAAVPTEVLISGEYSIGDTVTIVPATGQTCIPDRLAVTISVPSSTVTQAFEIDSSCDGGRGLVLLDNYASFESVGYSCDTTDQHNCFLDVLYEVEVCNLGPGEETIYELDFVLNGTLQDLTVGVPPEDLLLLSNECYSTVIEEVVERCAEREYIANATANATNPFTGPTCEDSDQLQFSFSVVPLPPTPLPSPVPSPAPSPVPTSRCEIDVTLDGCFNFTPIGDNNCQGRPIQMTFRYNGGDCSQSDNLQDRQNFDCFDILDPGAGPPPLSAGAESLVSITRLNGNEVYFEGIVPIGGLFVLNADGLFDKLAADMNFTIYDPEIGKNFAGMQQTVFVHLSCSQPLFLKDRFGASQVVQWIEDDGRNVSCFQDTQTGSLIVELNASTIDEPIELEQMTVIVNVFDQPINYTDDVAGIILEPGGEAIELPPINITVDLTERVRYTFFTTVIGRAVSSGVQCNGFDFTECIAGVALPPIFPTLAPTPSPTVTPFPTPNPENTTCTVRAAVECTVLEPFGLTCDTLTAPTNPRCTTGAEISLLVFQYTGISGGVTIPGGPDGEVYIEITDCETTAFFQGSAFPGDNITVNSRGNFLCETLEIIIQEPDFDEDEETNIGATIEELSLPTACLTPEQDPAGWTLGTSYGPMKLLQYNSDLDRIQAITATLFMNYAVDNIGRLNAIIESASLVSPFSATNPSEIVPTPFELRRQSRISIENQTALIDLLDSSGTTYEFELFINATSDTAFELPCDNRANFSFTL